MRIPLAATVGFEPSADWAVFLAIAACVLLAGEAVALIRSLGRGRSGAWGAVLVGARGMLLVLLVWGLYAWPGGGAIVAIGVMGTLWAERAYQRTTRPISPRTRALLLALRITIILLITVWVLRPVLREAHFREVRGVLLIGLDHSASMQRRDMPGDYRSADISADDEPRRRIDSLRGALAAEAEALREIARGATLEWFAFDETPTMLASGAWSALPGDATGTATAIGDCAQAVFDPVSAAGGKVIGIVLFSDGCNNTASALSPEDFAARMHSRGVGVYTVGVGSQKPTPAVRALTVRTTGAPRTVRAFGRMSIKPVIETVGLAGRSIRVTCKFAAATIAPQTRKITAAQARESFEFTHVPLETGFHRLVVRAKVLGKAPAVMAGKPEAEQLVQVTDRQIRLLYVEGRFRYETKYIARALGSFERIALHRRILLQPLRAGEDQPIGETLDEWLKYHAIIFGDVSASRFTAGQLRCIKQVVSEYGKGFCMIGGERSFGRGGWAGTPIADIMPVDLSRSGGNIDSPVQPHPTAEGQKAELMQIGPPGQSAEQAWSKLDPMGGANRLAGVKPAAVVLAETKRREPMIVAQNYGKGRTLAIAFDTTWRWVLSPGEQDTAEMQKRFWRQVALYLAAPKGNVWIHTNRATYDVSALGRGTQEVEVTAGVEDSQGAPTGGADVEITLKDTEGKITPVRLQQGQAMRRGLLPPPKQPGIYTLSIKASIDGRELSAEQQFRVVRQDRESAEVLADFNLLKRMAGAGGGQFVPLRKLSDLLEKLRIRARPRKRRVTTTREILAPLRWVLLPLLIALLCAEWALRKRKGLV